MIEYVLAAAGLIAGGGLAYGDIRYRLGKLEGKMDLISQNLTIYMDNNHKK